MTNRVPEKFGEYRVIRRIGKGGFGAVYLAENDLFPDHYFAVKVFSHVEDDQEAASQHLDELKNVLQLSHTNIVQVRGFGVEKYDGKQQPYIVMDFIEGPSGGSYNLKQHLRSSGGRLPPAEVKRIFKQILAGLSVVHNKRIAHLDLKPENILLDKDLNAYISDFGVSRTVTSKSIFFKEGPTIQGFSPFYASPEQIRHAYGSRHSDIFSLGIMLVECLTGSRPEILHSKSEPRVDYAKPSSIGLDAMWDSLLEHCLSIDPAYRFPNASVFLRALRQIPTSKIEEKPMTSDLMTSSPSASVETPPTPSKTQVPKPAVRKEIPIPSATGKGEISRLLEISEKKLREAEEEKTGHETRIPPEQSAGVKILAGVGAGIGLVVGGLVGLLVGDSFGTGHGATIGKVVSRMVGMRVGPWIGPFAGRVFGTIIGAFGGLFFGYVFARVIGLRIRVLVSPPEEDDEDEMMTPS